MSSTAHTLEKAIQSPDIAKAVLGKTTTKCGRSCTTHGLLHSLLGVKPCGLRRSMGRDRDVGLGQCFEGPVR